MLEKADFYSLGGHPLLTLVRSQLDNITFGAVKYRICATINARASETVLVDMHGKCVNEDEFIRKTASRAGSSFYLCSIDADVHPVAVPHPIERSGRVEGLDITWEWNKPPSRPADDARVTDRAGVDTCTYTQLPFEIFQLVCAYVTSPVQLLDFRLVCKRYREYVDANFTNLVKPFSRDLDGVCIDAVDAKKKVQMMCMLIPPPVSPSKKAHVVAILNNGQFSTALTESHCHYVHQKFMLALAEARLGVDGVSPDEDGSAPNLKGAVTTRFLVAMRTVTNRDCELITLFRYCYAIISDGECFYEAWFDDERRLHYTEFNVVRAHACLYALRHQLWDSRSDCSDCSRRAWGQTQHRIIDNLAAISRVVTINIF